MLEITELTQRLYLKNNAPFKMSFYEMDSVRLLVFLSRMKRSYKMKLKVVLKSLVRRWKIRLQESCKSWDVDRGRSKAKNDNCV